MMVKKIFLFFLFSLGATFSVKADSPVFNPIEKIMETVGWVKKTPVDDLQADDVYSLTIYQLLLQQKAFESAGDVAFDMASKRHAVFWAKKSAQLFDYVDNSDKLYRAVSLWVALEATDRQAQKVYQRTLARAKQYDKLRQVLRHDLQYGEGTAKQRLYQLSEALGAITDKVMALRVLIETAQDFPQEKAIVQMLISDFAVKAGMKQLAWQSAFIALAKNEPISAIAIRRLLFVSFELGKQAEALALAETYQQKNPQDLEFRLLYIRALAENERMTEAIQAMQRLVKENPENFNLLQQMGTLYFDAQDYRQAVSYYKQFITITQQQLITARDKQALQMQIDDTYLLLAKVAVQRKQYQHALAQLDKVKSPDLKARVTLMKAAIYFVAQQYDKAYQIVATILPESEFFPQAVDMQLAFMGKQGNTAKTRKYLQTLLETLAKSKDSLRWYDAVLGLQDAWGLTQALRQTGLTQITRYPLAFNGYNTLGYSLLESKALNDQQRQANLAMAKSLLERALLLAPTSVYVLDSYGWLQYQLGNPQLALSYLMMAWDKQDKSVSATELTVIATHLGEVYWSLGEKEKAQQYFWQAYSSSPHDKTLNDAFERLGLQYRDIAVAEDKQMNQKPDREQAAESLQALEAQWLEQNAKLNGVVVSKASGVYLDGNTSTNKEE